MPTIVLGRRHRRASFALAGATAVWLATVLRPTAWPPGLVVEAVVTGLGAGALAAGLVLTYRTFRIINFAYGAMGSVAAEVGLIAYQVHDLPWVVCVLLAVLAGVLVGLGVDAVMRRFQEAPRLVVTVATIGLLQVLIGLQVAAAYAAGAPLVVPPFRTELTDTNFRVDTSLFDLNHLLAAAVVGALLALLAWFMLRTDAGAA
ncbi:MAG TPA: hypothetical protein VFK43_08755, partial [Acidimicrobiales bacterium]|nr:hypothetical protein [Acidimicrobiales bacterium]